MHRDYQPQYAVFRGYLLKVLSFGQSHVEKLPGPFVVIVERPPGGYGFRARMLGAPGFITRLFQHPHHCQDAAEELFERKVSEWARCPSNLDDIRTPGLSA